MKTCVCCGLEKDSSLFYKEPRVADGLTARCKQCTKEKAGNSYQNRKQEVLKQRKAQYDKRREKDKKLRSTYGITLEQWESMFKAQGECCAICKSTSPNHGSGQFVVDHCHKFGQVRGILCGKCNVMLGQANDDQNTLFEAALYLISNSVPESIEHRKSILKQFENAIVSGEAWEAKTALGP
jgi:hypothetical protein